MSSDTNKLLQSSHKRYVSIPLEQGNVFRLLKLENFKNSEVSQSLWNRAMSSDGLVKGGSIIGNASQSLWNRAMSSDSDKWNSEDTILSQSLWNRAMSSDCTGVLEHCATRLARGTSQFFLTPSELAIDLFNF